MAETIDIIALWYGMVWRGGAEQIIAFACFNINVGKNKVTKVERI